MATVNIHGVQDTGKTLLGLSIMYDFIETDNIKVIKSNIHFETYTDKKGIIHNINKPKVPCQYFKSSDLLQIIIDDVKTDDSNIIYFIDEADRVLSHMWSTKPEQTEACLALWQDKKADNHYILTQHKGYGINKIARQATNIDYYIDILIRDPHWLAVFTVADWRYNIQYKDYRANLNKYFTRYNRWEKIH